MPGLVELSMPTVDADPGEDAELTVLVFNTGSTSEAFELQVLGPCAPWAFLDPAVVRLDAGDAGEARLVLRPPRNADVPAGPHPFSVKLTARTDPRVDEVAEGAVDVAPFEAFSARVVPEEVVAGRRGRVRVEVQNDGNCPLVARLEASADHDDATFRWDDDTLFVPAGTALSAWLTVRPRHRRLLGRSEPLRYAIRVESASRAATLNARVRARAGLPIVVARAAIGGLALTGLVAGILQVRGGGDGVRKTEKGLPVVIRNATIPEPDDLPATASAGEPPAAAPTSAAQPAVSAIAPTPGGAGGPAAAAGGDAPPPPSDVRGQAEKVPLHRLFDPAINDYLYVPDRAEKDRLVAEGLVEQGTVGHVLTARAPGTVALYRLRFQDGRHLFTYDEAERRAAIGRGAAQEGIAGYLYPSPQAGTTPVHRLTKDGVVYLTADNGDVRARQEAGWANEGVRGYVLV